jgi:hypothetical protein
VSAALVCPCRLGRGHLATGFFGEPTAAPDPGSVAGTFVRDDIGPAGADPADEARASHQELGLDPRYHGEALVETRMPEPGRVV